MRHHRLTRSAALGLALAALAAPTAVAQQQDLRSPDTRDAASAGERPAMAEARSEASTERQDLRSPDARDAAAGRGTFSAPAVMVVKVPASSPSAGGIDWRDAGIGAGGLLVLILVGLAGSVGAVHRRQGGPARRQTATSG